MKSELDLITKRSSSIAHLREPSHKLLRKLDKIRFKCDCGVSSGNNGISYSQLIVHLSKVPKCAEALVRCPKDCMVINDDKGKEMIETILPLKDLEKHLTSECPSMTFQCKLCLYKGSVSDKADHTPHKCI